MVVDADHDEIEKVSFSSMHLAIFHYVVIEDMVTDSFGVGSVLVDFIPSIVVIKETESIEKERNDLINVVGNIVGDVEVVERENKNREVFKVANFTIVSNDEKEIGCYM